MQPILKKQFVQLDGDPSPALPRGQAGAGHGRCRKTVRLLRVEEIVHALELTCSCGEITVVQLEYPQERE